MQEKPLNQEAWDKQLLGVCRIRSDYQKLTGSSSGPRSPQGKAGDTANLFDTFCRSFLFAPVPSVQGVPEPSDEQSGGFSFFWVIQHPMLESQFRDKACTGTGTGSSTEGFYSGDVEGPSQRRGLNTGLIARSPTLADIFWSNALRTTWHNAQVKKQRFAFVALDGHASTNGFSVERTRRWLEQLVQSKDTRRNDPGDPW